MLNQVVLVGRLEKLKEKENCFLLFLKINENEILKINVNKAIGENIKNYCSVSDVIGVKGKINVLDNKMGITAEKITLLSSKKEN